MPAWPEIPAFEEMPVSSSLASVAGEEEQEVAGIPIGDIVEETAQRQPSLDELAREHVNRGFIALKEGRLDQAEWEFEQAVKTALDEDIVRIAQSQLEALRDRMVKSAALERQRPVRKLTSAGAQRRTPVGDGLKAALRIGLFAALATGFIVAAASSAALCLGFLLGPVAGFIAGWLASGPRRRPEDFIPALIAGSLAGAGAVIGYLIGYPVSGSSYAETGSLRMLSCFVGCIYIALAAITGLLGWSVRKPQ